MKKILIIFVILILVILVNEKEYKISEDSIRFRVIANSNTPQDIIMKERVVSELSGLLFVDNKNINNTREKIYSNLENIEDRIKKLFDKYNYNKTFNVIYGVNSFPEKVFLGEKYPAGDYESLVIEIGESKGNNYFCILYPSLCMIDYEKHKDEKQFGFKISELLEQLF